MPHNVLIFFVAGTSGKDSTDETVQGDIKSGRYKI